MLNTDCALIGEPPMKDQNSLLILKHDKRKFLQLKELCSLNTACLTSGNMLARNSCGKGSNISLSKLIIYFLKNSKQNYELL